MELSFDRIRRKSIPNRSLLTKVFLLLGLFAGMPSIGIYFGNNGITLFTLILLVAVIAKVFYGGGSIKNMRENKCLCIMFSISFFSFFINSLILPSVWLTRTIVNILSLLLGELSFCFLYSKRDLNSIKPYFIKGLKINYIIQVIWGILQYVLGNYFGIGLNALIGLYTPKVIDIKEVTGIGWERAEYVFVLALGFILSKNLIVKSLGILCILLTKSRTGLIIAFLLVGFSLLFYIFNHNKKKMNKKISYDKIVVFVGIIVGIVLFRNVIYEYISELVQKIINYKDDASGVTHFFYYKEISNIIKNISLFNILFGYGGGASGYPYALIYNKSITTPWVVESTALDILWSFGFVGFFAFIMWCFKKISTNNSKDKGIVVLFIVVLIGGIFYTILPNFGIISLIILSSQMKKAKEKKEKNIGEKL